MQSSGRILGRNLNFFNTSLAIEIIPINQTTSTDGKKNELAYFLNATIGVIRGKKTHLWASATLLKRLKFSYSVNMFVEHLLHARHCAS